MTSLSENHAKSGTPALGDIGHVRMSRFPNVRQARGSWGRHGQGKFLPDLVGSVHYLGPAARDARFMFGAFKDFLINHPAFLARMADLYAIRHRTRVVFNRSGAYFSVRRGQREIRLSAAHGAYVPYVVREYDLYFGSVAPRSVDGRDLCDFSRPGRHFLPSLGIEFMFSSLPEGADTDAAYLGALRIKPGQVVLDAGAYCGLTAYLFARAAGPSGRVIAVEADPRNMECLQDNMRRLDVTNVTPVHAAVWKEAGTLRFSSEGNIGSAVSDVAPRQGGTVEVRSVTLLDLALELGLEHVDHVKMDIEGAEYPVLMSSSDFITRFRPDFVIEVHHDSHGIINVKALSEFFRGIGYRASQIKQSENEVFPLIHCTPA